MTSTSANYTIIPDMVEAFWRRLSADDYFKSLGLHVYLGYDGNFVEQHEYVPGFWAVAQSALPCFYLEPRYPLQNERNELTNPPNDRQAVSMSGAVCTHIDAAGFTNASKAVGAMSTIFDAMGDEHCGADSIIRSGAVDGFAKNSSEVVAMLDPANPNNGLYWEARFELEFFKTRSG